MTHYHLYAIGNALVDTEFEVSDEQLKALGVEKRHMTLIDAQRKASLLHGVQGRHSRRSGGGSAANTVVALSQLGGKGFYSCRVADDELGAFYRDDLVSHGVATNLTHTKPEEGQTGTCMVMITPDAERSMSTFLGATAELDHKALHPRDIAKSKIYYMEGYLAASPSGLAAALQGRNLAREAGASIALTLSDVSMINFCRDGLIAMAGSAETGLLDYLFCNEEEAQVWCSMQDFESVCKEISKLARVVCITRSAKGCCVLEGKERLDIPGVAVKALDTNGAGDMFAGAFLYAVTHGASHENAAWLANRAAALVVSQYGNRLGHEKMAAIKADFEKYLESVSA